MTYLYWHRSGRNIRSRDRRPKTSARSIRCGYPLTRRCEASCRGCMQSLAVTNRSPDCGLVVRGGQCRSVCSTLLIRCHLGNINSEPTCRLANKLNLKVADLAAIEGDYYKSISKYESVAKSSVSNNLMKCMYLGVELTMKLTMSFEGSVKDYLLKGTLAQQVPNHPQS